MTTTTEIRKRLEAKAGAEAGTREYWDCVAGLLDVAEAAQVVTENVQFIPGDPDAFYMANAVLRDTLAGLIKAMPVEAQ